jgi:hypothetical protein
MSWVISMAKEYPGSLDGVMDMFIPYIPMSLRTEWRCCCILNIEEPLPGSGAGMG